MTRKHGSSPGRGHRQSTNEAVDKGDKQAWNRRNVESVLNQQLLEAHTMLNSHHEQAKALLQHSEEEQKKLKLEVVELRAQLETLREKSGNRGPDIYEALVSKHHNRTTQMLIKRDDMARSYEAENYELRATLEAFQKNKEEPNFTGNDDFGDAMTRATSAGSASRKSSPAPPPVQIPGVVDHSPPADPAPRMNNKRATISSAVVNIDPSGASLQPPERLMRHRASHFQRALPPETGTEDPLEKINSEVQMPPARKSKKSPALANFPWADSEEYDDDDDEDDEDLAEVQKKIENRLAETAAIKKRPQRMDMKKRMKEMFAESDYDVTKLYHETGFFQFVAKHNTFDLVTMMVIAINAVWIGVDTSLNEAELLLEADLVFIVVENLFCAFFFTEVVIRFGAFKSKVGAFKDGWFVFDFAIVAVLVFDTWIMLALAAFANFTTSIISPGVLRILRLVKLTRVARIIRLLKAFPEVMVLLKGVAVATRSVIAAVGLLMSTIYVFAIAFTSLCRGSVPGDIYFPTLEDAMFTLLFQASFGDNLQQLATSLFKEHLGLGLLLLAFILIAPLTVMNMIVGVLVEVIRIVAATEQETITETVVKETLKDGLITLHPDSDLSIITKADFLSLMEQRSTLASFRDLGIDVISLVEDPDIIFASEEEVPLQGFLDDLISLTGSTQCTVKDIMIMQKSLLIEIERALDTRQMEQLQIKGR